MAFAAIFSLLTMTVSFAQTVAATPAASSLPDKSIQRIRTEDSGTRIDEVRVGGETQSITVQPKSGSNMPPYEIRPSEGARGGQPSTSSSDTNGARVWNVMKF